MQVSKREKMYKWVLVNLMVGVTLLCSSIPLGGGGEVLSKVYDYSFKI